MRARQSASAPLRLVGQAAAAQARASSCGRLDRPAQADQFIPRDGKAKHPADPPQPAVPGLAHQTDRLQPAEDLFYPLASSLAHLVAAVPGRAAIDRTRTIRSVLSQMRRHPEAAKGQDELSTVIAPIGAQ